MFEFIGRNSSKPASSESGFKKINFWGPLLLFVAGIAVYSNSLQNPFLFDDNYIIVDNKHIASLLPINLNDRWLVKLTFKINYLFGRLSPVGYHIFNLAVHLTNALLLFGILKQTFSMIGKKYGFDRKDTIGVSLACALTWVVHPLQTESVTYVCQRYESMMGMFLLLVLYAFIKGVQGKFSRNWFVISFLACLFGMGTKEVMVVAPVLVALYDYMFVAGSLRLMLRKRWLYYIGLIMTLGALALFDLRLVSQSISSSVSSVVSLQEPVSRLAYLVTQSEVILHYIRLSFVPHPLCLDYAWPMAEGVGDVWPAFLVVSALFIMSVVRGVLRYPAGYPMLWFFLILAPSSSIVPLEDPAAEHRMYLPLAAIIILVVVPAWIWIKGRSRHVSSLFRRFCVITFCMIIITMGWLTYQRNSVYSSELGMWKDVYMRADHNLRARNTLAVALLESGRIENAREHLDYVLSKTRGVQRVTDKYELGVKLSAIANNSERHNRIVALSNLGVYYEKNALYDKALDNYVKALRLYPYHRDVLDMFRKLMKHNGHSKEAIDRILTERVWFYDNSATMRAMDTG